MGRYLEKVRSLEQALTRPVAPQPGNTPGGNDINDIHDKTPSSFSVRLARGAAWLTATWAKAPTTDDLPPVFQKAEQKWAALEEEFRRLGGQGCALGPDGPCAADAFIVCSWCCDSEYQEMAAKVQQEGVLLTFCDAVQDFVAFVRSEADLRKAPPGFTPYLDSELKELFGPGKPRHSADHLRLVHAVKKMAGARVTGHGPALRGPGATEALVPPQPDDGVGPEDGGATNASQGASNGE